MIIEKLQLNKKFLVIESPIPFEIFCPEQNDGVKRRQGSWQMTIHDLLTKSHYPLNPIYNLELRYDETLLNENESVSWYTTDLNLGEALRGIDGQLVTVGDSILDTRIVNLPTDIEVSNLQPVEYDIDNNGNLKKSYRTNLDYILNFLITSYNFYIKTNDNYRYQFINGFLYRSIASSDNWQNETKIVGLQIVNSTISCFIRNSDMKIEIDLNSILEFQGFISGFEL